MSQETVPESAPGPDGRSGTTGLASSSAPSGPNRHGGVTPPGAPDEPDPFMAGLAGDDEPTT